MYDIELYTVISRGLTFCIDSSYCNIILMIILLFEQREIWLLRFLLFEQREIWLRFRNNRRIFSSFHDNSP